VYDRQQAEGEHADLVNWLDAKALPEMRRLIAEKTSAHFEDSGFALYANARDGYVFLGAWELTKVAVEYEGKRVATYSGQLRGLPRHGIAGIVFNAVGGTAMLAQTDDGKLVAHWRRWEGRKWLPATATIVLDANNDLP
jgi:hypothetical protein